MAESMPSRDKNVGLKSGLFLYEEPLTSMQRAVCALRAASSDPWSMILNGGKNPKKQVCIKNRWSAILICKCKVKIVNYVDKSVF